SPAPAVFDSPPTKKLPWLASTKGSLDCVKPVTAIAAARLAASAQWRTFMVSLLLKFDCRTVYTAAHSKQADMQEDPVTRKSLLWILISAVTLLAAPVKRSFDTWREAGGGGDSAQYSSLKQINKTNVKRLQVA